MSVWVVVLLGIIAVAQVGMAVAQAILAREVARTMGQTIETLHELRRAVQPIAETLQRVSEDIGRTTQLARIQVERVDQLLGSTAARIEETVSIVQQAIVQPIRQGTAIVAGVRAALSVFRGINRRSAGSARDDDDALFIG